MVEIEILEKLENPLLNRTEVNFRVLGEGVTPRRSEVKKALAENLGVKEELIAVDKIEQGFGVAQATGRANVYKDSESMKIELAYKIERGKPKEKKTEEKAEAPSAPAVEGKPEEKKGEEDKKESGEAKGSEAGEKKVEEGKTEEKAEKKSE